MGDRKCSVSECDHIADARGWCLAHYSRWRWHGDVLAHIPLRKSGHGLSVEERFWVKVNKDGALPFARPDLGRCWIWTGALRKGHGEFRRARRSLVAAHRFVYELEVGQIPPGLVIDHLCRVPRCVNPAHLEAVTNVENVLRGNSLPARNARKTHCLNGHEFSPENTRINNRGDRVCIACARAGLRRSYLKRRRRSLRTKSSRRTKAAH